MSDDQPLTPARMISIQKAALWEEAKGKLRAMAATAGECSSMNQKLASRHTNVAERVEAFILDFEEDGLHE